MDLEEEKLFSIRKLRRNISAGANTKRSRRKVNRRPRNSTRKWKVGEELVILEYFRNVIRQNQEIEKPTADVFYAKLINELRLEEASPTQTKNKVRHLKDSYIRAVKWTIQTGQDPESAWVRQCVLEICPHFDILSEIYGNKVDIDSSKVKPRHSRHFQNSIDATIINEIDETREEEDSGREFISYHEDSDISDLSLKQRFSKTEEQPSVHKSPSKREGLCDESLQCFKQFLSSTSDAINRAFPSPSPSLVSDTPPAPPPQGRTATTTTDRSTLFETQWKIEELKLQQEKLQLEKLRQGWERDIKEKELDIRRKEIETNERLRILEIEKDERMERFKIEQEFKLQIELANIKKNTRDS